LLLCQVDRGICSNRKRSAEGENPFHALPRSLARAEQRCLAVREPVKIVLSAQFHTEIVHLPYLVAASEVQGIHDCAAEQACGEVVRQGRGRGGGGGALPLSLLVVSETQGGRR
jgi:hypothetical protein